MSTTTTQTIQTAAALDAIRIEAERAVDAVQSVIDATGKLDLNRVGEVEAKVLMSAEHKALGFRPPADSLAAQAQAAAAKHPEASLQVDLEILKEVARQDAAKITAERVSTSPGGSVAKAGIDLEAIGEDEARVLMSAQHKALGYRPPPGSIAAEAQSAAAKHPEKSAGIDKDKLAEIARLDAQRIAKEREPAAPTLGAAVDLATVGKADAAVIESAEHKALGYRPPPDSLAAVAKSAAAQHPDETAGVSPDALAQAAREDALRVRDAALVETPGVETVAAGGAVGGVDLQISAEEARALQSAEQKILGYRPPTGSLAAEAQSAVDKAQ